MHRIRKCSSELRKSRKHPPKTNKPSCPIAGIEQVTISLKGEVKKVQHYQVRLGPDGQQQKTSLDPPTEAAPPSGGRMKQKIVAKKKEEYKDYAEDMKALAQQYAPPDPAKIQQAAAAGQYHPWYSCRRTRSSPAGNSQLSEIRRFDDAGL